MTIYLLKKEKIVPKTQDLVDEAESFSNNFIKTSIEWLNTQNPSHWLIQLSSFDSFNKALKFSEKFKDIEYKIVEYSHPKKIYLIMLLSWGPLFHWIPQKILLKAN